MSVAGTDPLTVIGYDETVSNEAKPEGPGWGTWPHTMLLMVSTSVGVDKHGKGTHSLRRADGWTARRMERPTAGRKSKPRSSGWGRGVWSQTVARKWA